MRCEQERERGKKTKEPSDDYAAAGGWVDSTFHQDDHDDDDDDDNDGDRRLVAYILT